MSSGTAALHLGLLAAGIGPGDEVIVPSFTFAATANAVALTGAAPVFADIEPDCYCLDPAAVVAAITPRTRAVMPVHMYGQPADMGACDLLAREHGLALFEDAAQAHGAQQAGRPVGGFGEFGAFSFYPTKNMTSGEGGMIATGNHDLARAARLLRNQGMERRYENEVIGFNQRMTDLHAAIGRVQLTRLAGWTEKRQKNAALLDQELTTDVVVPKVRPASGHVYHQDTIRVSEDRDGVGRLGFAPLAGLDPNGYAIGTAGQQRAGRPGPAIGAAIVLFGRPRPELQPHAHPLIAPTTRRLGAIR